MPPALLFSKAFGLVYKVSRTGPKYYYTTYELRVFNFNKIIEIPLRMKAGIEHCLTGISDPKKELFRPERLTCKRENSYCVLIFIQPPSKV